MTIDEIIAGRVRVCDRCGQTLPIEEFVTDRRRSDKHGETCKLCRAEYEARYKRNKDTHRWEIGDADHFVTRDEWQGIMLSTGGRCGYCQTKTGRLEMDHFVPAHLGGHTEPGNLVPSCRPCNRAKDRSEPVAWITLTFGLTVLRSVEQFLTTQKEELNAQRESKRLAAQAKLAAFRAAQGR